MPSSTYLIPHRGLGAVQALPIHGASVKGSEEFTVTLAPGQEGGLSVEAHDQIGTISAADRAEYPEIDLLFRAGLTPAATAQPHADGHVTLLLPRPGLCLPANNPPSGPYTMLGYAPPIDITDLPADLDIPAQARMHVLVNLVPSTDAVDVFFGPTFLTTLSPGPSLPPLADAPILAHAYHAPRGNDRVLSIYAGDPLPTSNEDSVAVATPTTQAATETFETSSFRAVTATPEPTLHIGWWVTAIALVAVVALVTVFIVAV